MASQPSDEKDPWSDKHKQKFRSKSKSEWYDPCQEAASKSIQCLNRNGGDRAMCQDYFQAYRDCKKNWISRRRHDVDKPDPTPAPEA
ncbi:hypothetical protein RB597_010446 [Gaeumannomyces tritici]